MCLLIIFGTILSTHFIFMTIWWNNSYKYKLDLLNGISNFIIKIRSKAKWTKLGFFQIHHNAIFILVYLLNNYDLLSYRNNLNQDWKTLSLQVT